MFKGMILLFGTVMARSIGRVFQDAGSARPLPSNAMIRSTLGEETPQELAELQAAERHTHNSNARSEAVWAGSKTWIDYDGNVRGD